MTAPPDPAPDAAPAAALPPPPPAGSLDRWRPARLVGLLLLVPGLVLLVLSYLIPSVYTVTTSFRSGEFLDPEWVGFENYRLLFGEDFRAVSGSGYLSTYWYSLTLVVGPVLAITLVALVLAYFANRAGWGARWLVRAALALPMVAIAPTALAASWFLDRSDLPEGPSPEAFQSLVRGAVGFTMFGLLVGVGVTIYLATLRYRPHTRAGAATLVAMLLAVITTVAVSFQIFAYPLILSPGRAGTTPLIEVFRATFQTPLSGIGAAAGTVLLAVLGLLGVLAVGLAIATRLRIEVAPNRWDHPETGEADSAGRGQPAGAGSFRGTKAAARHPEAVIGTVLVLAAVLAVAGYGLWPWLTRLLELQGASESREILLNTWLPPLTSTVVGMLAAALAGFAIGALRPLGRYSPGLLLLFAPWLFVGHGVLSQAERRAVVELELPTFLALIPPGWVVVPAVIVFALLFRGQEARWRQLRTGGVGTADATARALVLPALPMFALLGGAAWLVQAQSLLWNQVLADPTRVSGSSALFNDLFRGGFLDDSAVAVGLVLPLPVLLAFAAGLVVLQITYLDRIAIRVGSPAGEAGDTTGSR